MSTVDISQVDGDKCEMCGRCCLLKVWNPFWGAHLLTGKVCRYLDSCGSCSVYDMRQAVNTECLTAEQAAKEGLMPGDCPCVKEVKGYKSLVNYEK